MITTLIFLLILSITEPAIAGGTVAGATEYTQILNNIQLVFQYAQQIEQFTTQLQQYQKQLLNMKLNPASIMGPEVTQVINGVGGIMQAGESIGGTMAQIDANFSRKFKEQLAGNFAQNFRDWTNTSRDSLGAAMRSAGLHRDAYQTNVAALSALYNKAQTSQGTVSAIQTLSEISVSQAQQLQKLQDLLATQNAASSAYMAAQNAKNQAITDRADAIAGANLIPITPSAKKPYHPQ